MKTKSIKLRAVLAMMAAAVMTAGTAAAQQQGEINAPGATVTWAFNQGADSPTSAEASVPEALSSSSYSLGDKLTIYGTQAVEGETLTLLQPVLFAEEKIAVVSFILERADDPAILAQLGKAQQPWTLPLDSTLLSSLLDALPRLPLAAKLLFDALHPLVDSYSADVVALLPSSLLDACFSHFDDALYRNLLRLVLQLQPAFHSSFLSSLTAFSQSPFYASFFAELAALVEICLARSSSLAASLPALQSSPFLQDLLHSLALSDVSPSQFRLLHRLTQLPALHSVFAQLDIPSLCKQALHASVLQTDRLRALLAAASLASDADRAIAIVLLRSLQAIGKTAAQAAADEPIASPQCVLLVLEACDAHKSALEQVLRKQPELYARLVRTLLRNRLGDAAAIALLTRLVETAVRAELAIPEASAGHLLTLLTTHSQFDAMIRRAAEEMTAHSDAASSHPTNFCSISSSRSCACSISGLKLSWISSRVVRYSLCRHLGLHFSA